MRNFFEQMFFAPKWYHYLPIAFLSPLSVIYGSFMFIRRVTTPKTRYPVPIISVGNLQVGGSGKTPFIIALASYYKDVTIISRGYGRKSSGLVVVSSNGKLVTDVKMSGDEPMLMAEALPNASVIVSEKREIAIELAIKNGANLILLDDGFNRVNIEKYEILLEPQNMPNILPFPAGPLREFYPTKRFANVVLKEGREFKRIVSFEKVSKSMLLVTAISNPKRLDAFLPKVGVVGKVYLEDHAYFDEEQIKKQMHTYGATTLLVTQKDAVKMKDFSLPIVVMELKIEIDKQLLKDIDSYML